jgi:hypothetical protein
MHGLLVDWVRRPVLELNSLRIVAYLAGLNNLRALLSRLTSADSFHLPKVYPPIPNTP